MNLDSIAALVTGGSSGLGLATVRRLLAAGARAVVATRTAAEESGLAEGRDPHGQRS